MKIAYCVALALATGLPVQAVMAHEKVRAATAAETIDATTRTHDAQAYFTETEVLDQDGRHLHFFSDVLKDRVVLLNVVYTSCEDACPLITRKLKAVRDALGEELARKVHFVSITSDPANDTPANLKAFAAKNDAAVPNWTFLTGDKAKVDLVLARLGQLSPSVEGHSTLLIAGDVAAKRWNKIRPDAPPDAIAERLKLLTGAVAAPAARAPGGEG